jgi:hypothetical protein
MKPIFKTHNGMTMVISNDSCGGQENQYAAWLNKKFPSLSVEIGTGASGLYDKSWNETGYANHYWDMYCSQ